MYKSCISSLQILNINILFYYNLIQKWIPYNPQTEFEHTFTEIKFFRVDLDIKDHQAPQEWKVKRANPDPLTGLVTI